MAIKIELKRSAVPGKVPFTSSLELGEVAINTYDGKLYFKKDDGTESIVQLADVSGSVVSASYAETASYALNTQNIDTGSLATTGSNTFIGDQNISGSLYINSNSSTTPPLWVSASNLGDGVGAFRADSTEPDIFLNDTDGGYSTVSFANQGDIKVAFGRNADDDFYITRAADNTYYDDTFVISRASGSLSLGYGLNVSGSINLQNGSSIYTNNAYDLYLKPNVSGAAFLLSQDESHYIGASYNGTSANDLTVDGFLKSNDFRGTGSLEGTASYAATASYASDFTVANTLYVTSEIKTTNLTSNGGNLNIYSEASIDIYAPNAGGEIFLSTDGARIQTDNQNAQVKTWFFDKSGSLTLPISGSQAILNPDSTPWSASYALNSSASLSSSYAATSSFANNFTVAGTLTAQTLVVQTLSSSVIYSSGSNKFGNNLTNTQVFTGSVIVTGSLSLNGNNVITANQTSSFATTSSFNIYTSSLNSATSSFATSASFNAFSASINSYTSSLNSYTSSLNSKTSSFATTGSNNFIGVENITGSLNISGSTTFTGGSGTTVLNTNADTLIFTGSLYTSGSASLSGSINISGSLLVNGSSVLLPSQTSSFVLNSQTSSFATTGSNIFKGDQFISGSATSLYPYIGLLAVSGSSGSRIELRAGTDTVTLSHTTQSFLITAPSSTATLNFPAGNIRLNASRSIYLLSGNVTASNDMSIGGGLLIGATGFTSISNEKLIVDGGITTSYNLITARSNTDNYSQFNIQNQSSGSNASSDIVATNDIGTEGTYYVNLGINSSNFSGQVGEANDAYLYTTGSNLLISNLTNDKNISISTTGNGKVNVTGSLLVTGSITTNGTLTAQTLVVQTISSSVVYSSGSNTFGNSLSNTQSLTGSVSITGSLSVNNSNAVLTNQTSSMSVLSASYAATSSNILGGKATHIPFFETDTTLATSSLYQSGSTSIIINQDANTTANPEALYVWQPSSTSFNVISGKGNLDNYLQLNIQNTNQGTNSSSDVVATANNGNEDTNYINMGINSENFDGALGHANDAYLYSTGNHLHIGNASNYPVQLFAGGDDVEANNKLSLYPNNQHELTGSLDVSGSLKVLNGVTGSFSGSLAGTASFANNATSASYAATSSFVPRAIATASAVDTTITFARFDGSTFDVTVSQSGSVESASFAENARSASYALTASYALNTQTVDTASFTSTSSFNAYTSSINIYTSSLNAATGAFTTYTNFNAYTSSINTFSASINSYTASQNILNGTYATTSSLNAYTSSINSYTSSLNVATSSFVKNSQTSSMSVLSASYAQTASFASNFTVANTLTAQTLVVQTISSSVIYSSGSNVFGNSLSNTQVLTGSVLVTGSLSVNGSDVTLTNQTGAFATFTALNAYTSSINSYTSSLNSKTSSFATTGSNNFIGTENITGSLNISGSNTLIGTKIITGSIFISGSKTVIGTNTITGSFNVSGSQTFIGIANNVGTVTQTGSFLVSGSTTQIGNNNLFGTTTLSGSITISGSLTPSTPSIKVYGDMETDGVIKFLPVNKNIDNTISASYVFVSGSTNDLYFSQNGNGYTNTTRLRWLEGNLYTGLLNGGMIGTASSTVFTVSSGSGIVVNLNASLGDNPYPTVKYVNWPNLSASIAPLSASFDQTYVAIDQNAQIYTQGTPYIDGQYDTLIPCGIVVHQNRSTINNTKTLASVAYGWKQRSNVFMQAFGALKLSGFTMNPSSSLGLTVGSGTAFADGGNYVLDPNNPSYITDAGTSVSKIWRYRQSGSAAWVYDTNGGAGYTTIDPTQYSNSGSLTAVPGTGAGREFSIQRVFWFPNSVAKATVVYYGNATYTTEADAVANISTEPFVEAPNTAANAIFLGSIVVRNNADFTDSASYKFIPAGLFRSVGGSGGGGSAITTTLAGLSDVTITSPTTGQALIYDGTATKWKNLSFISASISGNAATATSASYALTASYALNATINTGSLLLTSSFNAYTASINSYTSSLNSATSSFTTTSSFNAYSASINTYTQSLNAATGAFVTYTNFNATTSSLNAFSASILSYTASQNNLNGTYANTSSLNTYTSSLNTYTSSLNAATGAFVTYTNFNSTTSSLNAFSASILSYTASVNNFITGINSYTSSLNAVTSSFVLNSQTSSMSVASASLATNVVGGANRILFNSATNTTTTSNNLTWEDNINLMTLGSATGNAGTISKIALYTSSFGGYGLGVSPAQLDYVSDGSHVFYKNGSTPTELVRISNTGDVSITGSLLLSGSLTSTGTITAQTLIVQTVSSSVVYSSGSNRFGNDLVNTQVFTGSVIITGSASVNGSNIVLANQTSSLVTYTNFDAYTSSLNTYTQSLNAATGAFATYTSLNAYTSSINTYTSSINTVTSSFVRNSQTSSMTVLSSSYAVTSSYSKDLIVAGTLTFDATLNDYASIASTIVGSNNLFTQPTSSYTSGFFKYTVKNGTNARTGEVMAVWNGTSVEYTDMSTRDLGNTADVTFAASIVTGNLQFNATTATSGWNIKTLATFI